MKCLLNSICCVTLILLSDSNTNVNSMINRRVSLFYRYPLEVSHHMVCLCTLYSACIVCLGTSELVGQHIQMGYAYPCYQFDSRWTYQSAWLGLTLPPCSSYDGPLSQLSCRGAYFAYLTDSPKIFSRPLHPCSCLFLRLTISIL